MKRTITVVAVAAAAALTSAPPAAAGSVTSKYGCGTIFGGGAVYDMKTTIDAPATAHVGQTVQVPVTLERLNYTGTSGPSVGSSTTWEIHLGGATSSVVKAIGLTSPAPWKFEGTLTVTYGQVTHSGGYSTPATGSAVRTRTRSARRLRSWTPLPCRSRPHSGMHRGPQPPERPT